MDALAQSAALENNDLSAEELMHATLARIDQVNGEVNAIVSRRDTDDLIAEARAADNTPRKGWLHGIPIAIKDLANVAGLPTSRGSPVYADDIAPKDDLMVTRLRAAGALIVGKTNTPEFGLGSHTFNPVHGATRNPYNHKKSSGGSSGGAAAALASRMLSVADGSDMMGSLRNPAGWNNVYGMRPTWGDVPPEPSGAIFSGVLSTAGPMARSPRDLAALLGSMTGADYLSPSAAASSDVLQQLDQPLPQQRIAWLRDWGGALPFEKGILDLSDSAMLKLQELGHQITAPDAPFDPEAMWHSWITLRSVCVAEGLGGLYVDPATRDALKASAQWEVERGLTMPATEIMCASETRALWYATVTQVFENVDVLALPSAQLWPFDVDLSHPTEIAGRSMDTYHRWMEVVIPASLLGLPVVNIPIGFGELGLPAGIQLIGPRGSDARLLQLAQQWHELTYWPQKHAPIILAGAGAVPAAPHVPDP